MDCYCDSRQNLILPQAAMSGFFVLDAEWFADKGCYRDERAKPEEDYLLMQMVSFRFFFCHLFGMKIKAAVTWNGINTVY
ncbi:hypothetical protein [Klebsiella aerogenes]|uniref:hypothetical protein n=1 Tax=Klebsiella aerogenes TaxID=548 RepID=UPI0005EE7882|nr:hypothetical protein [Klebsiella aerogenes]EKU8181536.1 hypothetical protein [Klebsiella aerogenes]EKW3884462.1 hypothetical protein [Klebsiella aerogenes]ELA1935170.1 hypothetical protein [Klebsiella aerogenes]ELA2017486.1 hypothetical protein [Klebsiella aerogenes]ELD8624368.1 hypothetical protein [Klebsiella aerogenes]